MADTNSTAPAVPLTLAAALAPVATVLIWSGNVVVTEAASGVIAPGSIAFYRWLIAFLVLLPFVARAAWKHRAVAARHGLQLAILGALGMVVYQSLAYEAAKTTSAVNMGVMLALMPLMSALLASLLAAERLSFSRVAGGLVSLGGLLWLTSHGQPATLLTGGFHLGDGLMLIAIAANSLYGVLLRRWIIPLSMWLQLFWQIAAATLLLVPVWLMGTISPITMNNLPLILYAAIPTSLIAPLLDDRNKAARRCPHRPVHQPPAGRRRRSRLGHPQGTAARLPCHRRRPCPPRCRHRIAATQINRTAVEPVVARKI